MDDDFVLNISYGDESNAKPVLKKEKPKKDPEAVISEKPKPKPSRPTPKPVIESTKSASASSSKQPAPANDGPLIELPTKAKRVEKRAEDKAKKEKKRAQPTGETLDGNVDFKVASSKARSTKKRNRERAERKERLERAARRAMNEQKDAENPEAKKDVAKTVTITDKSEKKKKTEKRKKDSDEKAPGSAKKAKPSETSADIAKQRMMGAARNTEGEGGHNELLSSDKFAAADLTDSFINRLTELEYITMTQIQQKSLKSALAGQDALIRAPTGSGKTLAFAVPLVERLLKAGLEEKINRAQGSRIIILSPTKELCNQTLEVLSKLCRPYPWLVCGAVTGGENRKSEKARLRKGVTILCATPGRVLDHLQTCASFNTDKLDALVLDEADRLLDLGFEKQIREIHQKLSQKRQTLLVSATLSQKVRSLAEFCLKEGSEWIGVETKEDEEYVETYQVPSTLKQWYLEVPCKQRLISLVATILGKTAPRQGLQKKAIIFFSSCDSVDFHYDLFASIAWPRRAPKAQRGDEEKESDSADKIFKDCPLHKLHGNLTSEERAGQMREFAAATRGVLLATDVAARGLDIPKVDWIFQYDPPQQVPEYLHRIGRTARLGTAGNSLLFLLPSEVKYLEVLKEHGAEPKPLDLAKTLHFGLKGRPGQRVCPEHLLTLHDMPSYLMGAITIQVSRVEELQNLARAAFLGAQYAYQTFPRALKSIFVFKELHLGHLAAAYALKESPKVIVAKHKSARFGRTTTPVSKKDHSDKLKSKRNGDFDKPMKGVSKKDVKQGSVRSTKAKAKRSRALFNVQDEFAC